MKCEHCKCEMPFGINPQARYCSEKCKRDARNIRKSIAESARYHGNEEYRKKRISASMTSQAKTQSKEKKALRIARQYEQDPNWKAVARMKERAKKKGVSYEQYVKKYAITKKPKVIVEKYAPVTASHSAHMKPYCEIIGHAAHVEERRKHINRQKYHEKVSTIEGVIHNRMKTRLRQSVARQLKKDGVKSITLSKLGYTPAMLVARLEETMPEGATWGDFMNGDLHIDHFIPCAAFDLSIERHVRALNSLVNLRLMWAKENLAKNSKFYGISFGRTSDKKVPESIVDAILIGDFASFETCVKLATMSETWES